MRIQQWSVAQSELCPVGEESVEVVAYADHVAAVAEAEQRGRTERRVMMCGCDCCQNSNPTCFDHTLLMPPNRMFSAWVCGCTCPGCINNVIVGAIAVGVTQGVKSGREGVKADAPSHPYDDGFALGRATGRAETLDAARDAVAALSTRAGLSINYVPVRDALAAIDALRGEP